MNQVEQKLLDALATNPVVEHSAFVETLDHRDKLMLLDTVRDMQKRGVISRDISEKRDGRRVLKYVRASA